ncbi:hypothetical protein [Aquibacillus salsiterrae]|uniref:Uncharacterized protein n=1 Tax=Aquibacillus salsiterrae TaxID=2950439 RepID=A0A9X3WEL2_9BACI|nr:hypothetical protein [Aquibacillus salsiterrae]MDC3418415.1 hypothetical protein [Aquibacillus salsiterrae]
MNVSFGFKRVLKHPSILLLPIVLQVFISFVMGFALIFGVNLSPTYSFGDAAPATSDVNFQFTLPVFLPLIEDINQSLSFVQLTESGNWMLSSLYFIFYQLLLSMTMAMYLGKIKQVILLERHDEQSLYKIGKHYVGRILVFQLVSFLCLPGLALLLLAFFPLGILAFILLILFSLTPYLIVLEDKSLGDALSDSPRYLKKYFVKFLPLALGASVSILFLSLILQSFPYAIQYYMGFVAYTLIGSGFITAFMYQLHTLLHNNDELEGANEATIQGQAKWRRWSLFGLVLFLPLLGVKFAFGQHVTAFQNHTAFENAIYYKSNWSDAFNGSEQTMTTYGFEQNDALELSMPLPDRGGDLYGRGNLTWKVDKDKSATAGNSTSHWEEEEFVTSEFIYRLVPVSQNGKEYYATTNGGYVELVKEKQSNEPMDIAIFVMNEGNDVFVFQYKKRFNPETVIRIDDDGKYFVPSTSSSNVEDFKYFWYSNEPFTKDRILNLVRAKNEVSQFGGNTDRYVFEYMVAAMLQEADGEALLRFDEYSKQLNLTTNLSDKTAIEWTAELEKLYGDADLTTFLSYFNKQNEQNEYDQVGWSDEEEINAYQVIVPFLEGSITLNCTRKEGQLTNIEVVLP